MHRAARIRAGAIVVDGGRVLLNRFPGYHNFPGGGVEAGETVATAVVREVREETGLAIKAGECVFALEHDPDGGGRGNGGGGLYSISFYLRCHLAGGPGPLEPERPDTDPRSGRKSRPVWVAAERLPCIRLLPRVNRCLLEYVRTGIFGRPFLLEPCGKDLSCRPS